MIGVIKKPLLSLGGLLSKPNSVKKAPLARNKPVARRNTVDFLDISRACSTRFWLFVRCPTAPLLTLTVSCAFRNRSHSIEAGNILPDLRKAAEGVKHETLLAALRDARDEDERRVQQAEEHGNQKAVIAFAFGALTYAVMSRSREGSDLGSGTITSSEDIPGPGSCRYIPHNVLGSVLEEGEEGEAVTGIPSDSIVPFAAIFVNATCVLASSDPCLAHKLNALTRDFFRGLRVDFLFAVYVMGVATHSFIQLGGIPRPWGPLGVTLFAMWMGTQMGQYLVSFSALLMRLTAPSAMRSQLDGCLTIVDDVPIVDLFFASTIAAQPVLIASLISMLLYAFALTTGVTVWAGRALPRDKFVEAASKGEIERARFDKWLPLATLHYYIGRTLLYASCLSPVSLIFVVKLLPSIELGRAAPWCCILLSLGLALMLITIGPAAIAWCGKRCVELNQEEEDISLPLAVRQQQAEDRAARRANCHKAFPAVLQGPLHLFNRNPLAGLVLLIPAVVGVDYYLIIGVLMICTVSSSSTLLVPLTQPTALPRPLVS